MSGCVSFAGSADTGMGAAGLPAGTDDGRRRCRRCAALAALQQLPDGTGGGASLPEAEKHAVHERLAAVAAATARNAALAAQASRARARMCAVDDLQSLLLCLSLVCQYTLHWHQGMMCSCEVLQAASLLGTMVG